MVYMGPGDIDPKTIVLQILLNRRRQRDGAIPVDGTYGADTEQAIREFQRTEGLEETGSVGPETWRALLRGQQLSVVDVLDGSAADAPRVAAGMRADGSDPIVAGSKADTADGEVKRIADQVEGKLCLLRFRTADAIFRSCPKQSVFCAMHDGATLQDVVRMKQAIAPLREYFAPFGSVEIHGCAMGLTQAGRDVIRALSDVWGVPVTAPMRKPPEGAGLFRTHRFEGLAFTAYPGGSSLEAWAAQFPAAAAGGSV